MVSFQQITGSLTRDKVIPRIMIAGTPGIEVTKLNHTFNSDGSVIIKDEWNNELRMNPLDIGYPYTFSLFEDANTKVIMQSYKYKYRGKDYEVQVLFYFDLYGNVKVKIKGTRPSSGQVKISFQAATSLYDSVMKRFWSGTVVDGELIAGVGFGWSDVTSPCSFSLADKTLSFSVNSEFELDPSTISTSTSNVATAMAHQRKTIYANGRHWALFSDGTYGRIYSSPTGDTPWTLASEASPPPTDFGRKLSMFLQNGSNYAHQAWNKEEGLGADYIRYRRMLLNSDGTITFGTTHEGIPQWEDEDGYNGATEAKTYLFLRKVVQISPNIYSICYTPAAVYDYTTEINIKSAGVGCKTPFTPYTTVNADDFGFGSIGSNAWQTGNAGSGDAKAGCRFQATRTESISKIRAYIRGKTGTINVKAGVYSDSAGAPNALLGQSAEVAVTTTASWVEFTFATPISVTAGTYYWLALIWSAAIVIYYSTGSTNQFGTNTDTYADGFSDPFGTPTYADWKASIFAYSTSSPTSILSKGWTYGTTGGAIKKLYFLDGKIVVVITLRNHSSVAHAGKLWVKLWVSANSDLSSATVLADWASYTATFDGTLDQVITATINFSLDNPVGDAILVNKYFYLEALWEITTAGTNGNVQFEADASSVIYPPQAVNYYPNIIVDDQGYPWIAWMRYNQIGYYPYVIKGNANDGSWDFRLCSVARKLDTLTGTLAWRATPVPMTGGKVRVMFHRTSGVYSDVWNGSSWTEDDPPAKSLAQAYALSAINDGDNVILAVLEATTFDIEIIKQTYGTGWDASWTVVESGTGASTIVPVIAFEATNKFKIFWASYPTANHVYYRTVTNWVLSDRVDWIDESTDGLTRNDDLTCFYKTYGSYIGLLYMSGTSNIRYAFLTVAVPVKKPIMKLDKGKHPRSRLIFSRSMKKFFG